MSSETNIPWCDSTWNPWRGCQKVSPGCANCYAEKLVNRFGGNFAKRVRAADATFSAPLRWAKRPWVCDECGMPIGDDCECGQFGAVGKSHRRRVFSLSLGDWLDPEVPTEWLADMLDVIRRCPNLDFLLLTKLPELWKDRIAQVHLKYADLENYMLWDWLTGTPPSNICLGTTVENQEQADKRIPELLRIPAKVRFLSCEPLLGPIDLTRLGNTSPTAWPLFDSLNGKEQPGPLLRDAKVDWVIVGCESGPVRRNQQDYHKHARSIIQQCQSAGVPVFHKQMPLYVTPWGKRGRVSHDPTEWPADLRVQQFPEVER